MTCKIRKPAANLLIRLSVLLVLLVLGALIFVTIEEDKEEIHRNHDASKPATPIPPHFVANITAKHSLNISRDTFSAMFNDIQNYIRQQKRKTQDENGQEKQFHKFTKWLYFCFITLTTIGYGDVYPRAVASKLFLVPYCLFGIPLMISVLAIMGERLTSLQAKIILRCQRNPKMLTNRMSGLCSILSSSLLLMCFMLLSAVITACRQKWNYIDAFYYWFATCSTIGYGDLIANGNIGSPLDVIGWMIMRFLGLCFVAGVIHACVRWIHLGDNDTTVAVECKQKQGASLVETKKGDV